MPYCPECKEKIDCLDVVLTEKSLCTYTPDGGFSYSEQIESNVEYWKCPLCQKQLKIEATTTAADEFLDKG